MTDDNDGADIANVLALAPGAVSAAAAAMALRLRSQVDDPRRLAARAHQLLNSVSTVEARVLAQLLGDTGDAKPADSAFAQPETALLHWRTDGGDRTGSLSTIANYYRGLDRGRLVILGEAGAGKTVLALKLLLDLSATARDLTDRDPAARIRVPIWISLSGFIHPANAQPAEVRNRFDSWVAAHLTSVHAVKPALARALVADGWVLPVLDGLDELDPDSGPPEQARQVLAALNLPAGPALTPVVLTCRTDRYRSLATGEPLEDATVVTMRPLEVTQVIGWLRHRYPDATQPDGVQRRWQPVVNRLRRHPNGRLAACLRSPLRLYLAVTVYRDSSTAPRKLCDLDRSALDAHLLGELVPAVTAHHPRTEGGHHNPDDVRHWLRTLAQHLAAIADQGGSGADFQAHELWRTTGCPRHPGRRIRYLATAFTVIIIGLPLIWYLSLNQIGGLATVDDWFLLFAAIGIPSAALWPGLSRTSYLPRRGKLRLLRSEVIKLPILAAIAMTLFLVAHLVDGVLDLGVTKGVADGFADALAGAVTAPAALFTLGLILATDDPQQGVLRPSDLMRGDLVRQVYVFLVLTLGCTLAFWPADTFPRAFSLALTIGTLVATAISPWPRYMFALYDHYRDNSLPIRLGRLRFPRNRGQGAYVGFSGSHSK